MISKNSIIAQADLWRNNYNPLRGLTLQRVVTYLEAGERGEYADLQWCYRTVEKRDATLRGVIRKLKAAIKKLDWDIKIPSNLTPEREALAERQQQFLRAAYDKIENIRAAIGNLVLAEFRGYTHLEKIYQGDALVRLDLVPQWHWCRDGIYGEWMFNPTAQSGIMAGEPVDRRTLIIHEVDDPADEIALIAFVRKSLSQKDWDGFVETFGLPSIFAILSDQVPEPDRDRYEDLVAQIIGGSSGVLPAGTDLKTPGEASRGIHPFDSHIRYQDEQIVLAGTSGTLTMLTDSTGMNSGQADAQTETFDALAVSLAGDISEVFQTQLDAELLAKAFPGHPTLAYFELAAKEEADVDAEFDRALKASQSGFKMSAEELSEKTGYRLSEAPLPTAGTQLFNRAQEVNEPAGNFEKSSRELFAQALAKDFKPLRERLEVFSDLLESDDPADVQAALAQLKSDLPDLYRKMRQTGATDQALEDILTTASVNGVDEALKKLSKIANNKG